MLLSPHKIAQTRNHALDNLLDASSACLDVSQRMSDLFTASSRASLARSSRQMAEICNHEFDPLTDSIRLIWNDKNESSRFIDQFFEILGDNHKLMIEAAEAQVRIFDEIILASMSRISNFSPRETDMVFATMRSNLEGAENALHNLSSAAIQTVKLAEQEIHQLADNLAEKPKTPSRTTSKSRKKAAE